jgi:serine/threonine protein kinase
MVWRDGEQVGPYQISSQLGQGGMATVYKAYHAQLDRHVAIKVMHQTFLDDESFVARFKREAQIVASLTHPHIVPVFDYNEYQGQPYLVMKYIEGVTLKQRIFKRPPTLEEILDIMKAVGSALTFAHSRNVLHRDVKPSNIVIDTDNIPYLADFGLARLATAGESTMSADMLLGTPHYISPEQASGRKDLDGRTDLYSLGIVLYELLVGRVPFMADTPYAVIHDHIYTPLPSPSEANPDIPAAVEDVLIKATAKKPNDRYATANDMVEALEKAIHAGNLTELNPERASVASSSLAQLRDDMLGSRHTPAIPAMADKPTEIYPTPTKYKRATVYQPNNSGRYWMLGGCGTFILICLLSLAVLLNASNTILKITELSGSLHDELPNTFRDLGVSLIDNEGGIPIYQLPDLPTHLVDAMLISDPEDFITYLIAAQAYWETDKLKSYAFVAQGYAFTDDVVSYLMTAAGIAQASSDPAAAATYVVLALHEAKTDTEQYQQLRPQAGEMLYRLAEEVDGANAFSAEKVTGSLYNADELREISTSAPALFVALRARLVSAGTPRLVDAALNQLKSDAGFEAEINLLHGEISLAEHRTNQAKNYWQKILDTDDAPEWTQERAEALLEENNLQ